MGAPFALSTWVRIGGPVGGLLLPIRPPALNFQDFSKEIGMGRPGHVPGGKTPLHGAKVLASSLVLCLSGCVEGAVPVQS